MWALKRRLRLLRHETLSLFTLALERLWLPVVFGRKSASLAEAESGGETRPLLFVPYNTPACRFQHKALSLQLELAGQPTSTLVGKFIVQGFDFRHPTAEETSQSFKNLAQAVLESCQGDTTLARGALDEFLRDCPVDVFFEGFSLPQNFRDTVASAISAATQVVSNHSGIVLADGAYLGNRALMSAAFASGKPVFVFNPDGQWMELYHDSSENYPQIDFFELRDQLETDIALLKRSERFLRGRFSGKSGEFDSGAFRDQISRPREKRRKILFLHVTRDANQIPLVESSRGFSIFSSFFEWADFCLEEISKDQENWHIKVHPSARFYNGETDITSRLLKKHGISEELVQSCPSTLQILREQWPVYTHSGTVGFETAIHGYRSHVCSTRFPSDLVYLAKSRAELLEHLAKPLDSIEPPLSQRDVRAAGALLYLTLQPQHPELAPARPQPDRRSPLSFVVTQVTQGLSLAFRYSRPKTRQQLSLLTEQILSRLASK